MRKNLKVPREGGGGAPVGLKEPMLGAGPPSSAGSWREEGSEGARTPSTISTRAAEKLRALGIEAGTEQVRKREVGAIKHGEIEFTALEGHRARYIIAPSEMESPDDILRWMFIRQDGWLMRKPSLLLSCYGGLEENWHSYLSDRTQPVFGGICQAVNDCKGWFDLGNGSRGGMNEVFKDGIKQYWTAFESLPGFKKVSVLLAIRSLEETEFADKFESCSRPVTAETTETQLAANSLQAQERGMRVIYPSVDEKLFPELFSAKVAKEQREADGENAFDWGREVQEFDSVRIRNDEREVQLEILSRYLFNGVTHVVFVQNNQLRDALRKKLHKLAIRATMLANGNMSLITPGSRILNEALAGVPIICLKGTGGAAEALGLAMDLLRQSDESQNAKEQNRREQAQKDLKQWLGVPHGDFLFLDTGNDSVDRIVYKVTSLLSKKSDADALEVGYHRAERTRILYAWELYVLFQYNAKKFRWRARVLHFILVAISIAVTIMSIICVEVDEQDGRGDNDQEEKPDEDSIASLLLVFDLLPFAMDHQRLFKLALVVFPLLNAFFLAVESQFRPLGKWIQLESNAAKVRSEIYLYRAKVDQYMPQVKANVSFEELFDEPQGMVSEKKNQEKEAAPADSLNQKKGSAAAVKKKQQKDVASRCALFSRQLEKYNSDAIGADLMSDSLQEPPTKEIQEVYKSLYNSPRTAETRQGFCSCCKEYLSAPRSYKDMSKQSDEELQEHSRDVGDMSDCLCDDGVQAITAEDYMNFRLLPLTHHYKQSSKRLTAWATRAQISIFLLTGSMSAASFLEFGRWVPLFVAVMTGIQTTLEFENVHAQLRNVNQSLQVLENLRIWWHSLSMVERRMPYTKSTLVSRAEDTTDAEISAWIQSLSTDKNSGMADSDENDDEQSAVPRSPL